MARTLLWWEPIALLPVFWSGHWHIWNPVQILRLWYSSLQQSSFFLPFFSRPLIAWTALPGIKPAKCAPAKMPEVRSWKFPNARLCFQGSLVCGSIHNPCQILARQLLYPETGVKNSLIYWMNRCYQLLSCCLNSQSFLPLSPVEKMLCRALALAGLTKASLFAVSECPGGEIGRHATLRW